MIKRADTVVIIGLIAIVYLARVWPQHRQLANAREQIRAL